MMTERETAIVRSGLKEYMHGDPEDELRELVKRWRDVYPEAAGEQSSALKPLIKHEDYRKQNTYEADECWYNDTYYVSLRRREDQVFGSREGMIQLGIAAVNGTARHDWREYQGIKNQLAGPECEAFELYPAESRLLDPSNYYTLWCFPGVRRLKIGQEVREIRDADRAFAMQRRLPEKDGENKCLKLSEAMRRGAKRVLSEIAELRKDRA